MCDILIVGAGPAGLTAAIYALRAGKSVTVYEKEMYGGQIAYSPRVENYPAVPEISGGEFADRLTEQARALGADIRLGEVRQIQREPEGFSALVGKERVFARAVILATGTHHRKLGLPEEDEYLGRGLSYCAVCDGNFSRGKRVAVVGGGNTALKEALYLSDRAAQVYLIHRRDTFRAEEALCRAAAARANILPEMSATVRHIRGAGRVESLLLCVGADAREKELAVDGVFVAVGQQPQGAPFADLVPLDSTGFMDCGEDTLTPTPGLFVAGDCRRKNVRQLTTAVGDGATAALAATDYLNAL